MTFRGNDRHPPHELHDARSQRGGFVGSGELAGVTRAARAWWCGALLALGPGCKAHVPYVEDETELSGIHVVRRYVAGADTTSPLVVGIHGRGGKPEHLAAQLFDGYAEKVEIALPRGPLRHLLGWKWFDDWQDDESFTHAVDVAEQQLWPAIAEMANGRKVYVVGMSQGAILAYAIARRHPDQVAYAFPIAGFALRDFIPAKGEPMSPIYAVHGTADTTVPIALEEATMQALHEAGAVAQLREFAGAKHEITDAMRRDVMSRLSAALREAR
jgi:phospholipase/carboxylesterase